MDLFCAFQPKRVIVPVICRCVGMSGDAERGTPRFRRRIMGQDLLRLNRIDQAHPNSCSECDFVFFFFPFSE